MSYFDVEISQQVSLHFQYRLKIFFDYFRDRNTYRQILQLISIYSFDKWP